MKFAKINLHLSFLLLLMIALFAGFLREACLFLIVIFLHEIGHIFFLLLFKGKIKKIYITAIGGLIELSPQYYPFAHELLISSGGLIINVVILFVLNIYSPLNKDLTIIRQYNQIMLYFNLMPIYPLDGYQIINSVLKQIYEEEFIGEVLYYLSLLGITILSIFAYLVKSFGLGLIVIFLLWKSIEQKRSLRLNKIKKYAYFKRTFQ